MPEGESISFSRVPLKTVKVHARDEDFRIVQLQGNLFVCSKANGNCCCGWTEKGRAPINTALYEREWKDRKIRNRVHLSFTGCLGPCAVGNNAFLQLAGRSMWFKDLNDDALIPLIFNYIEALLSNIQTSPPSELSDHIFERYLTPISTPVVATEPSLEIGGRSEEDNDGAVAKELERLDPVCLMEVDPATARWKSQYNSPNIYFCAPACKKSFDKDPLAYL